jgi:diaminopimelate decarboxylase
VSRSSSPHLSVNDRGHLTIGGLDTIELADEYGTPLYVVDAQRIRHKYRLLRDALSSAYPDVLICYAYKANSNLSICELLKAEGAGAAVASAEGIRLARKVGVAPELIVFDGPSKTARELETAISERIGITNVESMGELEVMENICATLGVRANVGVRLNLNLEAPTHDKLATGHSTHKFGISEGEAIEAFRGVKALPHLDLIGVHSHAGSQILDPTFFGVVARELLRFVAMIKEMLGVDLDYVNFGGGIGIPYDDEGKPISPSEYAQAICGAVSRSLKGLGPRSPKLVFEPGRFIVGDSSVLLSRINFIKKVGMKEWLLTDAGMNDLVRPAMYGARHKAALANKMNRTSERVYNVGGPICESSDVFAEDIRLPRAERLDLMAFYDVGAYGLSMASNYNIRPIAAMVMVDDGKVNVVRRRQTFEDLIACDVG